MISPLCSAASTADWVNILRYPENSVVNLEYLSCRGEEANPAVKPSKPQSSAFVGMSTVKSPSKATKANDPFWFKVVNIAPDEQLRSRRYKY